MSDPIRPRLSELKELFTADVVKNQKINCIKLLRQITGEGLKETKDFFEQVVQPAVLNSAPIVGPETDYDDLEEIRKALSELRRDVDKLKRPQVSQQAKGLFDDV